MTARNEPAPQHNGKAAPARGPASVTIAYIAESAGVSVPTTVSPMWVPPTSTAGGPRTRHLTERGHRRIAMHDAADRRVSSRRSARYGHRGTITPGPRPPFSGQLAGVNCHQFTLNR